MATPEPTELTAAYRRVDEAAGAFMAYMEELVPQLERLFALHREWNDARAARKSAQARVKATWSRQNNNQEKETTDGQEAAV